MDTPVKTPLRTNLVHDSAARHVTGEARYVDDLPPPRGLLHGRPVVSPHAHARLVGIDASAALAVPGVTAVLTAADVPGLNDASAVAHDEPLLADGEVHCVGQHVALVVAETEDAARRGAEAVAVTYEPLPAILDVPTAIAAGSFHTEPLVIARGEPDAALASAHLRLEGELESPAQEHFYLETQAALAVPEEDGCVKVYSSTQHPSEVQAKVAEILGIGRQRVVVECPRMGGGFGGKETQGVPPAGMAALASRVLRRPVKVRFDRDQDMVQTGKRHAWYSRYEAGFAADGRLVAFKVHTFSNAGWAGDLSKAILERCLFHLDGAYFVENAHFEGRAAKTNLVSATAYRGFGGPQGMMVVEHVMDLAAARLGLDPAEIRRVNLYGDAPRDTTPYEQPIGPNRLPRIWDELMASSEYARRREALEAFNASATWVRRGLGVMPVKFGISFTTSFLNQAGALVHVYGDGTVQLNHGGTEMGQGLNTKMLAICAHELGVPLSRIRMMPTATDKVPNTSATAASSGSDLNGQAVRHAAETIRERLRPVAAALLGAGEAEASAIRFEDGRAILGERSVPFEEVAGRAYLDQVPLSATGYYRTPDLHWDSKAGRGRPFHYFAFGMAVVEVEVSGLTGEMRILRADILHDVGASLVPSIDRGQVEGGFVQGLGWLTTEELTWDDAGRLLTHGPSTYKIPALGDVPEDLRVALLERAPQERVIHGSKAVGEPPFMLAIGVVSALRQAVAAFGPGRDQPLRLPATAESLLRGIEAARAAPAQDSDAAA